MGPPKDRRFAPLPVPSQREVITEGPPRPSLNPSQQHQPEERRFPALPLSKQHTAQNTCPQFQCQQPWTHFGFSAAWRHSGLRSWVMGQGCKVGTGNIPAPSRDMGKRNTKLRSSPRQQLRVGRMQPVLEITESHAPRISASQCSTWGKHASLLLTDGDVVHISDVKYHGNLLKTSSKKKKSTFYQVCPSCLGSVERAQKRNTEENKKLIKVQQLFYILLWGRAEIKRILMPQHHRTAAHAAISTTCQYSCKTSACTTSHCL